MIGCELGHTRCTGTNTLCVVTLLEETVDTTDGELETRLCGTGLRLAIGTSLATRRRLSGFSWKTSEYLQR